MIFPEHGRARVPTYDAFISYSHAKDKPIAAALQSVIQKLGKAWYQRRAVRVFRDDTSLSATPHLWPSIQNALAESGHLIMLASPEAASSPWISREVEYWLEHKTPDTIFIGLTAGELAWDEKKQDFKWSARTPLPNALKRRFETEPKWVDLRAYRDGADPRSAKFIDLGADFASAIRGVPKEDLMSEEIRQERRTRRIAVGVAGFVLVLAGLAILQWRTAEAERALKAEQLRQTQINESKFLGTRARELAAGGNAELARSFLSRALPVDMANPERPIVTGAATAIPDILAGDLLEAILVGHSGTVNVARFGPSARLVLTGSYDGSARLWDAGTGALLRVLDRHRGIVTSATFSLDGTRVVTASFDGTAAIWDTASGAAQLSLDGHADKIWTAGFSPDGDSVVTASADRTARIWDAQTGRELQLLQHGDEVRSAVFKSDGKLVLTASNDKTARVWEAATGAMLTALEGHTDAVNTAVFNPNGTVVVTASNDKSARIWDVATGRMLRTLAGHAAAVNTAVFSPDGKSVLTASNDGTAMIWDAASGERVAVLKGHQNWVTSAVFSPDGTKVLTASIDHTARIWDASTGGALDVLQGHNERLFTAFFSPDGKQVITSSADKTARIWNTRSAARNSFDLAGSNWAASFSRDGERILTASADKRVRVWDAHTGVSVQVLKPKFRRGEENDIDYVAFSPDGTRIVGVAWGAAFLWEASKGIQLRTLGGYVPSSGSPITSAAFSPDSKRILIISRDPNPVVWDADTGKEVMELEGHDDTVNGGVFSPDGKFILTASDDGTARLWNSDTGAQLKVLNGHEARLSSAVFNSDGTRVLTASDDQTARIWDATTGNQLQRLKGHRGKVNSALFNLDGTRAVTASDDTTARVWDVASGKLLQVLEGHTDVVNHAVFSPRGERIATASSDKTARVWDAATGAPLQVMSRFEGAVKSAAFNPDGSLLVTSSDDQIVRISPALPDLKTTIGFLRASAANPLSIEGANGASPEVPTRLPQERTAWPNCSALDAQAANDPWAQVDVGLMLWQGDEKCGVRQNWEQALFHFALSVKLLEERGYGDSEEIRVPMLYRANLAHRLPMEKVAEIWDHVQAWKNR